MRFRLDVDRVIVRAEAERHEIERAVPAVQEAFRLLAELLDRMPVGRDGGVQERVITALDAEVVSLEELLSPRGAHRLAEAWYRQLLEAQP
jgi:hypothetical protein